MFQQHLDTAPLWEAYRADCECPLCHLAAQSEKSYVENFLGGSVMEPAVRVEVNEKGFCARHLTMLYGAGNRLGLALMADTHLRRTIERVRDMAKRGPERTGGMRFGARAAQADHPARELTAHCILCDRLSNAMERYEKTLIAMWSRESAFCEAFLSSKGLCVEHWAALTAMAPGALNGRESAAFLKDLNDVTLQGLERVEKELEWFTLKFDYRNQDKPWGNSRDAVERALIKLRGSACDTVKFEEK